MDVVVGKLEVVAELIAGGVPVDVATRALRVIEHGGSIVEAVDLIRDAAAADVGLLASAEAAVLRCATATPVAVRNRR
jgi:hypothetical protein